MSDKRKGIIKLLRDSVGTPVSGQDIGDKLGISRAMVWKYIKALRKDGYHISSSPRTGYVLATYPDIIDVDELESKTNTRLIGKNIRYYPELISTNNTASEIAPLVPEGTVVIAETQKGGRGRMGTEWQSIKGGIWLSLILKPSIPLESTAKITLVAGIAVTNSLREIGLNANIKWPNDVLVKGKKICGILTEVSAEVEKVDYIVLGIGINANVNVQELRQEIRDYATSISKEKSKTIDRNEFVASLLYEFEQQYIKFKTHHFADIVDEWIALSDTIGKNVKITTPSRIIEGRAVSITEKGSLVVVDSNNKRNEIIAGTCRYNY